MSVFLNTIILLGALQGFIVCVLLFRRRTNRRADRMLGWLILLMSLASLNLYFLNTGFFETHQVLLILSYTIPMIIIMPIGPLIYFYIRAMLDPGFRLTRRHRRQFLTVIIDVVPELAAIIFIIGVHLGLLVANPQPWGIFIDDYNVYADIPRWLSLTIYLFLSRRYIRKVNADAGNVHAAITRWLRQFITVFLVFQLVWFLYLIPYVLPDYRNRLLDAVWWYPIYIPLAIMIYWLGIKGYLLAQPAGQPEKKKKGVTQELPETILQQAIQALRKTMEEDKLYLNPALQLELVTAHTGVPAKLVSAILNQHLQKNFNEWVNGYRVEAFKEKVQEGHVANMTIAGIAAECGFNSQASFQRIFKQSQGMTPTQYLKSLEKEA